MSTALQTKNVATIPTITNLVICKDVTLINWYLPVKVIPDARLNPENEDNGDWVIVATTSDARNRAPIVRGDREYCLRVHHKLVQDYAYDNGQPRLFQEIEQLLDAAQDAVTQLEQKGAKLLWSEQAALVERVYRLAGQANTLASLYLQDQWNSGTARQKQRRAGDLRKMADFTIFGERVWNIRVYVDEIFVSRIQDLSDANLIIREFGSKKTPKFVTHELVANDSGKILVRGSLEGCRSFRYAVSKYFTQLRESQQLREAQQRFEEEKAAARTEISQALQRLEVRLRENGEPYGDVNDEGSVAYDLSGCIAKAGRYHLDFAQEFEAIFDLALTC